MLLFKEMRNLGFELNSMTYNSLLSSLLRLEDLIHGKQVHCLVMKEGLDFDPYIAVSLLTMYSKCGSSEDFIKVCSNVMEWDQVSFNSIISGFSHLGSCWEVLQKFSDMRRACLDMDVFTLASVPELLASPLLFKKAGKPML
ncbi:hypothetical protein HPP92_020757 [Vanilla planifolia]|uniref:Pentatricopeptide repeat-containing protein n=1 Tax=Vanilla planifolia TaxID=51239 RepID=A0A835UK29_VANPL|nr:hypothetical protein HPP92_020757 [Vanilla planifolia]